MMRRVRHHRECCLSTRSTRLTCQPRFDVLRQQRRAQGVDQGRGRRCVFLERCWQLHVQCRSQPLRQQVVQCRGGFLLKLGLGGSAQCLHLT